MRSSDALSVFPATIDLASGDGNWRPNLSEMHPVTMVSAIRHSTMDDHRMPRLSHAHQRLVNDAPRIDRDDEGLAGGDLTVPRSTATVASLEARPGRPDLARRYLPCPFP